MMYRVLTSIFMILMGIGISLGSPAPSPALPSTTTPSAIQLPPTTAVWTLKDGTPVTIRPVSGDAADRQRIYTILKDPDTQRFQRDGNPWPDASIDGTYQAYVAYWKALKDLTRLGIKPKKISLAFMAVDPKGNLVGTVGIQKSTRGEDVHEIYYALMPAYRRQGLGTKMGQFILEFYQKLYGVRRMEAAVMPQNKASIALLKKIGFTPLKDAHGIQVFRIKYDRRYDIYQYVPKT